MVHHRILPPPSDKEGEAQKLVMEALEGAPEGALPMVIGDINANLDSPWGRQEEIFAAEMAERGMCYATRNFLPRRTRRTRGR